MSSKVEYDVNKARRIKVSEDQQAYRNRQLVREKLIEDTTNLFMQRLTQFLNGEAHIRVSTISPGFSNICLLVEPKTDEG